MSKFKAGEFWETRDGSKAFIAAVSLPNPFGSDLEYPVRGFVEDDENFLDWTLEGKEMDRSCCDLIKPWVEPKRVKGWLNIYYEAPGDLDVERGSWVASYVRTTKEKCEAVRGDKCLACIEIDVLEGEGLK